MSSTDRIIAQFMNTTCVDQATAKKVLEDNGYDVERAITSFLDSIEHNEQQIHQQREERLRPRKENSSSDESSDKYIRPPDSTKRQRLIETNATVTPSSKVVNPFRNISEEAEIGRNGTKEGFQTLSKLYAPPFDIMFEGTFDEAKFTAEKEGKLLLVNIQNDTEFACHILNRDIWKDEMVEDIVSYSCIFWQRNVSSMEGRRFASLYNLNILPHISIIDSRTGRQIWSWDSSKKIPEISRFLEILSDTFEKTISSSNNTIGSVQCTIEKSAESLNNASKSQVIFTDNGDISDEVCNESVKSASSSNMYANSNLNNLTKIERMPSLDKDVIENCLSSKALCSDLLKELKHIILLEEPQNTENQKMGNYVCIRLRLANGKIRQRQFLGSEKVKMLYKFAQIEMGDEAKGKNFDICTTYPVKSVKSFWDITFAEAGLSGAAYQMVWMT